MTIATDSKNKTGYECRFAVYVEPPYEGDPDLHLVKLTKHNEDGTTTPEVKLVYNYKRPFWIAYKGSRNYVQHKEWEDIDKLIKYDSTQSELIRSIAKALGNPGFKGNLKRICESPYVYGAEILSTAVLKKALMDKYPGLHSRYSVAVADIETDTIKGTKDIEMLTISFKDKVFTAVSKSYFNGETFPQEKFQKAVDKYLRDIPDVGDIVEKRNLKFEFVIVENDLQVIKSAIAKAHEWKPDFLAFWNIDFDMTRIIETCQKYNVDPKDIFSDPIVPKKYRYFRYKRGPKQKKTASGLVTPIKPAAQWHTVYCTSSFYPIDAMCVYKHVRTGKQEEQSYALDAILKRNKLGGKLKFTEADHLSRLEWHQFMQSRYKFEYIVYNIWDCVSIEMLDEKTTDMCLTLPMFSGFSDFENFNSQPRRAVDKLHYFCLNNKRVIGTTPPKSKSKKQDDDDDDDDDDTPLTDDEMDELTLSLRGWIITLPAHLIADNGLNCISEFPDLKTNVHIHVGDQLTLHV
jgi:hypothetical protein